MTTPPRIAICPGSFDPITVGHVDVIRRALGLADRVIVAVGHRPSQSKRGLFTVPERLELIRAVFAEEPRVEAADFQGLLVELARERGARLLVRGIRGPADMDYELRMAQMNRRLLPELETVFLAADPAHAFISASLIREVASLNGDVAPFVPAAVAAALRSASRR